MKVAILARGMQRPGGVSRLVRGYVRHLPLVSPHDEFFVLTDTPLEGGMQAANVHEVLLAKSNPAVFDHLLVPRATRHIQPDVFLATKNSVPLSLACPCVCVFLDLAYFGMPQAYPLPDRLYMRTMFRRSARAAARVVAISNWTKRDIGRFLGHDALEKTRVVYPGTESAFRSIEAEQRNWARNGPGELPPRFIVYAGEISPRKNLTRLLEAVANCSNDTALVLTGHRASRDAQFRRTMEAASRKREIRILGPQPDETLVVLYNLAQASVYPSLYEGFGFPVLESLACGTPVAASNATSIPEAAGDAAVFFDPTDVASITMAIERLLGGPGLRDELRAKGLRRAAQFTWEKSARGVLEVLRETL